MPKTIQFAGSINLPTADDEAILNELIGWSATVEIQGGTATVPNPVTQDAAFYDWINRSIMRGLGRTKQERLRRTSSVSDIAIAVAAPPEEDGG